MNLKDLNLTEADFDLIVDGLDQLPSKGLMGDFMMDLLGDQLMKDDPESLEKAKRERLIKKATEERKKALLCENVKILQGKMLMMKRYLIEQGLLSETNALIQTPES